jgi:hypothetical protein
MDLSVECEVMSLRAPTCWDVVSCLSDEEEGADLFTRASRLREWGRVIEG